MFRILSLVITIVILIGMSVLILGYTSNPKYTNSLAFEIDMNSGLVWNELINITYIPERKRDVQSVEILEQFGRLSAWKETLKNGGYRIYRMNEFDPGRRLQIELTESSYGLTGIWTFELFQQESYTDVVITEESNLDNVPLRGTRIILGRNHDLVVWSKYVRVGIAQSLLKSL